MNSLIRLPTRVAVPDRFAAAPRVHFLLNAAFTASFSAMRGRAIWALSSGGAVFLASALAQAQCTKDIDCKGDRVCDAGKCTSPGLPPAPPPPPGSEGQPAPPGTAPPPAQPPPVNLQLRSSMASEAPPAATTSLGHDE